MFFFHNSRLLRGSACIACLLLISCAILIAQQQPASTRTKAQSKSAAPDVKRLYLDSVQALQQGSYPRAREGFERLVKINPRSAEYRDLLGYVLMLQGEPKQAITVLQAAVELDPRR